MRIFLAGATGAIGRPLIELLLAANHQVVAITRSSAKAADLAQRGVTAHVCDVFDREALLRCVQHARPEVVIHQLTALPKRMNPRQVKQQLTATNRLRQEGTRILLDAAVAAGAERFVVQSIAFAYRPDGTGLNTEDNSLYDDAPAAFRDVIGAVQTLEQTALGCQELCSIVLRYGFFYGPGTAYALDGSFATDVQARRVPIAGNGAGAFSFIHVEDAATATLAAMQCQEPGIYNIVDDDPAPVAQWLPAYAKTLGAKRPLHAPKWLVRLLAGPYAIYLMCNQRGASNTKAKRTLDWTPRLATWRDGFEDGHLKS